MDFFEPLDASQTLLRVGSLYLSSSNVRTFIWLAVFFVLPASAILLMVVYQILQQEGIHHPHNNNNGLIKYFFGNLNSFLVVLGSQSLLKATLGAISEASICVATIELFLQRNPKWYPCLQRGVSRVTTLLIANVMATMAAFVGFLCLYLPGLFIYVSLSVATPVVIMEQDQGAVSALVRSFHLTTGYRVYILICLAALGLMYWILSAVVNALAGAQFLSLSFHLLRVIPASVFYPALCILKTVMYVNLRVVKEGLTAEQLSREVGQPLEVGTDYRRVPLVLDQDETGADESGPESTTV